MKQKIIYALLVMVLLTPSSMLTAQIKVMSMNIREGAERAGHLSEPYVELIRDNSPDIVCIQEVDWKTTRNGGRDWLNEVAAATGMFPYYAKSFDYRGGAFGCAVLSRYPFYKAGMIRTEFERGTDGKVPEPRSTGYIYVQFPDGCNYRIIFTHLSLGSSNIIENMGDINTRILETDKSTPTLLVGDFNANKGSTPIVFLKAKWQDLCPDLGNTFPVENPSQQLDYIMGFPKHSMECVSSKTLSRPDLSDHCFIITEIKQK